MCVCGVFHMLFYYYSCCYLLFTKVLKTINFVRYFLTFHFTYSVSPSLSLSRFCFLFFIHIYCFKQQQVGHADIFIETLLHIFSFHSSPPPAATHLQIWNLIFRDPLKYVAERMQRVYVLYSWCFLTYLFLFCFINY